MGEHEQLVAFKRLFSKKRGLRINMVIKKKRLAFFLTLSAAVILAACGSDSDETDGSTSNETDTGTNGADNTEQVLRVTEASDIPSMDMTMATDLVSFTVMNNVFEGLYTIDNDNETIPAIAEGEPEISEDGRTYTFTLREDAVWSNGDPVTAHDFVYSWRKMVDPDVSAGYSYMYDGFIENGSEILEGELDPEELGVEAVNDYELQVTLVNPAPYFIDLLTQPFFFPQNEAFVEEQGEDYGSSSDNLVYNGPFVMTEWNQAQGGSWVLVHNEDYWGSDEVPLERVEVEVISETSTGLNLYENDELDMTSLTGEYVPQYNTHEEYHTQMSAASNYFDLNEEDPALANVNIREALAKGANTQEFTENVLQNGSIPIPGHVPYALASNPETGTDFREDSGDLITFNLEEAQAAWELGLEDLGVDSLELELLTTDTEDSLRMAEFYQNQYQTNLPGLTITIRQVPFAVRQDALRNGDYQIGSTNWYADFADPVNYIERFHTDINRGNYSFPDVDELIDAGKASYDDELARWNYFVEAEQLALGTYYVHVPTYQPANAYLLKERVKDLVVPVFGPDNYRFAYIEE